MTNIDNNENMEISVKKCMCGCGGIIQWKPFHRYYGTPDYIWGHSRVGKDGGSGMRGRKHSPESIRKMSEASKGKKYSVEQNAEMQRKRALTLKITDPDRLRFVKAKKTRADNLKSGKVIQAPCWNKGKKRPPEFGAIIKKKAIERHFTDKIRNEIKVMYCDDNITSEVIAKNLGTTPAVIVKRLREEGIKIKGPKGFLTGVPISDEHARKSLRRRIPTSLEQKFSDIAKNNNLPYKFVGDGSFILAGKNPDFININGEKIAIEVYAEFYKKLNGRNIETWRIDRKKLFNDFGWDLLFFSEKQVNEKYIMSILGKGGAI